MPGTLPTSNVGGNNQTSPGVGGMISSPTPIFSPPTTGGTLPSANPYVGAAPTSTPTTPGNALYNTQSSQAGTTDINKQLTDILGKGVGGSLNNILQNLSGTDSAIFQQWLASQVPAQAQAEASMRQGLGAMGVSGNSSVAGLAEANLGANFNATAAGVNADLMKNAIATSTGILQGAQGLAAQEVAASPMQVLGNVLSQVGSDAATFFGGGSAGKLFGGGGGTVPSGGEASGISMSDYSGAAW